MQVIFTLNSYEIFWIISQVWKLCRFNWHISILWHKNIWMAIKICWLYLKLLWISGSNILLQIELLNYWGWIANSKTSQHYLSPTWHQELHNYFNISWFLKNGPFSEENDLFHGSQPSRDCWFTYWLEMH